MSESQHQAIRDEFSEALAEIDPAMRFDSPLLTGRPPLADRAAKAVMPIVERELDARDAVIEQIRALHPDNLVTLRDGTQLLVCDAHGTCDTWRVLSSLPSTGETK